MSEGAAAWQHAAAEYESFLDSPLGRLREDLTWPRLFAALPPATGPEPPVLLDAGCGVGRLTATLAERGYHVWALDPAQGMLDRARAQVAARGSATAARVTFFQNTIEESPAVIGEQRFAGIVCHNILEYVTAPDKTLAVLAALLAPAGILSVLTVNRWSEVLRAAINERTPAAIEAALQRRALHEPMTDSSRHLGDPDEIAGWLVDAGLRVLSITGVRVLSDFLPGAEYAGLLACEQLLASTAPDAFARIGRQVQLLARKPDRVAP